MSRKNTYVNEYAKEWSERAARIRWGLEPDEQLHCDTRATARSPMPEGTPVEVKSCRVWIENGDQYGTEGRFHLKMTKRTHQRLLDESGYYGFVVYKLIEGPDGNDRLLIVRMALHTARLIDWITPEGRDVYKLPHSRVFNGVDHR